MEAPPSFFLSIVDINWIISDKIQSCLIPHQVEQVFGLWKWVCGFRRQTVWCALGCHDVSPPYHTQTTDNLKGLCLEIHERLAPGGAQFRQGSALWQRERLGRRQEAKKNPNNVKHSGVFLWDVQGWGRNSA